MIKKRNLFYLSVLSFLLLIVSQIVTPLESNAEVLQKVEENSVTELHSNKEGSAEEIESGEPAKKDESVQGESESEESIEEEKTTQGDSKSEESLKGEELTQEESESEEPAKKDESVQGESESEESIEEEKTTQGDSKSEESLKGEELTQEESESEESAKKDESAQGESESEESIEEEKTTQGDSKSEESLKGEESTQEESEESAKKDESAQDEPESEESTEKEKTTQGDSKSEESLKGEESTQEESEESAKKDESTQDEAESEESTEKEESTQYEERCEKSTAEEESTLDQIDSDQSLEKEESIEEETDCGNSSEEESVYEETESEESTIQEEEQRAVQAFQETQSLTSSSPKHFKAKTNIAVYDNRGDGPLKPVGKLKKDQVYSIVRDYGNWWRVQFGDIYGYVRKSDTTLGNKSEVKNWNKSHSNTEHKYKANQNVTIYDNTSGSLVSFGELDENTIFPIASDYGDWWRVIYLDRVGYIHKSEGDIKYATFGDYFKAEKNLAIYDNRGNGPLKKIGEVKQGQTYKRVSDYGNWHRIQFGDIYGYIRKFDTSTSNGKSIKNENKNYQSTDREMKAQKKTTVYDNSSGNLVPFASIEKDATISMATDYGNWWRIVLADRVGYVNKDDMQAEFKNGDDHFRVHQNNLPVYDNRGSGALEKVGSLQKGQAYSIVSDYGNWWRVQFGDFYGYVRKSGTGYATASEIPNPNKSYRNTDQKLVPTKNVAVYDNTSGSLVSMGNIDEGVTYSIASDYGNWWRVIYLDRVGYVNKADVDISGVVNTLYNLTLDEALNMQMNASPQTDQAYAYVSKTYIENNRVTASALNVRGGPSAANKMVGQLQNGARVNILGETNGWYQIEFNHRTWVNAVEEDVRYYLDPNNFINDSRQRFQFLDLSKSSNAATTALNQYLSGKGTLSGQGKAFIDAGKKHGVNDVYLMSHAILETGHGTSTLADGVMYNGVKVYNMFGVGAYDECPVECGAKFAYEQGWTTPYDAIVGGATFIGNNYVKPGQNTLYKMRWNPEGMDDYGYATHQYATDIGWASKQVSTMYNLYQSLNLLHLQLDIPNFKR
ncbi:N-acetylglucosaminidase [Gracilibacillus phocaeensis]|uniref:N-acetylglucosaminidase n=1 Tax=Gracilibacillus phocaeensis TaxID=2042304 RepID=UPI00256FC610|nr:N-acetylglucosaminidase [Gracilibacillus phocaeensis]